MTVSAREQGASVTPALITIFFSLSALLCGVVALSFTEIGAGASAIWVLKPAAFAFLSQYPHVMIVGFSILAVAFAFCAIGLSLRKPWAYRLAIGFIAINAISAAVNLAGTPTYAGLIGLAVAGALIWWLSRPDVRSQFMPERC